MSDSSCEVYLHLVWATKRREPILHPTLERPVYRVLRAEALRMGCSVLAINGTEDHLHLLLKLSSCVDIARLVNQLKGVSSNFVNGRSEQYSRSDDSLPRFLWQRGYGACSVGQNQLGHVIAYINQQKEHHAEDATRVAWEPKGGCG